MDGTWTRSNRATAAVLWVWWVLGLVLTVIEAPWPFLLSLVAGVAVGVIWYAIEVAGTVGRQFGLFVRSAAADAKLIEPSEPRPAPAEATQSHRPPDSRPARVPD